MGSGKLPPLNTVWQQATAFAARQHRDQTRADGETPYIAHPVRVALTILDAVSNLLLFEVRKFAAFLLKV